MFTGIVQCICKANLIDSCLYLYLDNLVSNKLSIGDSVAVNGVCLTVVGICKDYCTFNLSEETMSKTSYKFFTQGLVNVELAIKFGSFLGGHIMSGHIHQTGTIVKFEGENMWIDLGMSMHSVMYKGSIAIDGISLTIAEITNNKIRIALIPETIKKTTLYQVKCGDIVNVEFNLPFSDEIVYDDSYYMRIAIKEGEKGMLTAPPNPWVGCVVVKDFEIISSNYHEKQGSAHAEFKALSITTIPEGTTIYVTLEPCCHHGKTPPCVDIIIAKKVSRVVIGVIDPDKRVYNKGIEKLLKAGIKVDLIKHIDKKVYEEVKYSLRQYLYYKKNKMPYCTVKIALSVDNCYRSSDGKSKWISNDESRKVGHILRASSQAIIVGALTVQQDDPELTVRYNIPIKNQPLRVVIDGDSLTSSPKKILSNGTMIMTTKNMVEKWTSNEYGINCIVLPNLQPKKILETLSNMSPIMHVLIEGGCKIQKSFFSDKLVNEVIIFRSPNIFGDAYIWDALSENATLKLVESKQIFGDIMERYLVYYDNEVQLASVINPLDDPSNELYPFDELDKAIQEFKKFTLCIISF